ncbi:MAG TPA: hypothetical protein VD788_11935 [Candidatus Polarisedimenticolaceae bacterium]|nr:hypothetical protein [Candidatus Polarisedimenticolaceae bacterium]
MGRNAQTAAAVAVHLLTASGGAIALFAIEAISGGRIRSALGWMCAAVVVDGVDGTLARRARVRELLPRIDGALLDNVVDYVNYAIVPAWLIHANGLLPERFSPAGTLVIAVAAAFQFSHTSAKSEDHLFRGFPSYWNVTAFYLLVGDLAPGINLAVVCGLALLSVVPLYWVYPSRTPTLRRTTIALTVLWGAALITMIVRYPRVDPWLARISLLYVAYYTAVSLWLTYRRRRTTV